jgi:alkyl hydroperoxide reductase subunit AhpC
VCTSEFLELAAAADRFAALDCELLGHSVDSLFPIWPGCAPFMMIWA